MYKSKCGDLSNARCLSTHPTSPAPARRRSRLRSQRQGTAPGLRGPPVLSSSRGVQPCSVPAAQHSSPAQAGDVADASPTHRSSLGQRRRG